MTTPINSFAAHAVRNVQQVRTPAAANGANAADATQATRSKDRLELSGMSDLLAMAKNSDIRADKVAAIKAEIAAGTYETDAKLDAAADKLLDELL